MHNSNTNLVCVHNKVIFQFPLTQSTQVVDFSPGSAGLASGYFLANLAKSSCSKIFDQIWLDFSTASACRLFTAKNNGTTGYSWTVIS